MSLPPEEHLARRVLLEHFTRTMIASNEFSDALRSLAKAFVHDEPARSVPPPELLAPVLVTLEHLRREILALAPRQIPPAQ